MSSPWRALPGLLLAAVSALACSGGNDTDAVGLACHVIVDECGAPTTKGDCVDLVGALPPDCVSCIAGSGCDFPSCQRTPTGCRIPLVLSTPTTKR